MFLSLHAARRRRAERRASDAVLALDEQRTKWRERERECARVLCAAEQRIEAQRVKIAEFEKVGVHELLAKCSVEFLAHFVCAFCKSGLFSFSDLSIHIMTTDGG